MELAAQRMEKPTIEEALQEAATSTENNVKSMSWLLGVKERTIYNWMHGFKIPFKEKAPKPTTKEDSRKTCYICGARIKSGQFCVTCYRSRKSSTAQAVTNLADGIISESDIARKLGISRQRVHQIRKQYHLEDQIPNRKPPKKHCMVCQKEVRRTNTTGFCADCSKEMRARGIPIPRAPKTKNPAYTILP